MGFGLGVTRCGAAAMVRGACLLWKRVMEFATEFLFVAANAPVNGKLKHQKLRKTAFHIADSLPRSKLMTGA
jgi:hypothetical protein